MTVKELAEVLNDRCNLAMYERNKKGRKNKSCELYIPRDILCLYSQADRAFIELHGGKYIIESIETDDSTGDILFIYYRKEK